MTHEIYPIYNFKKLKKQVLGMKMTCSHLHCRPYLSVSSCNERSMVRDKKSKNIMRKLNNLLAEDQFDTVTIEMKS
ncbi:hypothetical protein [Methanolobus halotolerans]|uniref:Uncharacterized protein n=1 Tax=Methanolobus halotolerans TaxID=2052935 RepID=A0A4E0QZT5_9EURY|nr:hypothetical protein [Methanolobus halotolerans]TGC09429.1 hypothetical protein CUN85_06260 [Methanolobus halotolerans]